MRHHNSSEINDNKKIEWYKVLFRFIVFNTKLHANVDFLGNRHKDKMTLKFINQKVEVKMGIFWVRNSILKCKQLKFVCYYRRPQKVSKKNAKRNTRNNFFFKDAFRIVLVIAPGLFDTGLDSFLVFPPVFFEELRRHRVGRRIWVRITQQRLNGG